MFEFVQKIVLTLVTLSLTNALIVPSPRHKENHQVCQDDTSRFRICYIDQTRLRSIVIWFSVDESFDQFKIEHFRFVLRSIDPISLTSNWIQMLTNFTDLTDRNNSLTIFHLDHGQYEVCIEFRTMEIRAVVQPRDSCISFRVGHMSHLSFRQDSVEIFLTLALSISSFFLLGLIVQWRKTRRMSDGTQDEEPDRIEQRTRSSSLLSATALKKQRDRIIRRIFRRHLDESDTSTIRQWARNRAFRHRISNQTQQITNNHKQNLEEHCPTKDIYIIPIQETSVSNLDGPV